MRFVVRSTFTAVGVYVLVLGCLALWSEFEVRSVATSLMEDTANLVGSEIAGAMSESALAQLVQGDAATRQRLVQAIADVTARSNVVASITVVGDKGQVVVSD